MAEFPFVVLPEELPPALTSVIQAQLSQLEIAGTSRDDPAVPVQTLSHCDVARSRLLRYLQGKPRLEALLCEFLKPLDEVETAFFQLLLNRTIDAAVGAQLDGLGEIVGELRRGRSDSTYRLALRVRLRVLRSNGRREELIAILKLMLGASFSLRIREYHPAALTYEIVQELVDFTPAEVARVLRQAKGAGINLQLLYALDAEANTFAFSSQVNAADIDANRGFANTAQSTGGHLIGVVVVTGS